MRASSHSSDVALPNTKHEPARLLQHRYLFEIPGNISAQLDRPVSVLAVFFYDAAEFTPVPEISVNEDRELFSWPCDVRLARCAVVVRSERNSSRS